MVRENITRRKIMDVASDLFYNQGYNSTGINQILEEAGVARASFFKYFPTKHHLLTSYIETREKEWFQTVHSYIGQHHDPREKLLALFDFRRDSQLKSNFTGCAFNRICAEIEKDDMASLELLKRQKNSFRNIMRELAYEVPKRNSCGISGYELGDTLFMILEGATNMGTVNKDAEAISSSRKIAESLLYN